MSAGTFEVDAEDDFDDTDDTVARLERPGAAAPGAEPSLSYDLTVVTSDVSRVVAAAAGWLCDRVRAGWQVTVVVPPGEQRRALQIIGVGAETVQSPSDALRDRSGAAWAVDAAVLDSDVGVRREVQRALGRARTEVTVWGASPWCSADRRFSPVRHQLSAAARAFKKHALLSCGHPGPVSGAEDFRSAALWYPIDGTDLVPISAPD
ncbi:hypothetical protein ACAG25_22750 [Mycobacterium sp. pV006]|uniref:hypothetical protein n=1 Tax=Mycobacterium sp. pV006 TaxID=3238983 RepID=UPI00351BD193